MTIFLEYLLNLFLTGGGLVAFTALYKAFIERKKTIAETKTLTIKTPAEVDKTKAETQDIIIGNLQEDNRVLREDRDYFKGLYEQVQEQVAKLITELDQYRARVRELQDAMDAMGRHSPAQQQKKEI